MANDKSIKWKKDDLYFYRISGYNNKNAIYYQYIIFVL